MQQALIGQAGRIKTIAHYNQDGVQAVQTYHDVEPELRAAEQKQKDDPKGRVGFFGDNGRLACRLPAGIVEKIAIETPGFMKWPTRHKLAHIKKKMFEGSLDKFAFAIK